MLQAGVEFTAQSFIKIPKGTEFIREIDERGEVRWVSHSHNFYSDAAIEPHIQYLK